MTTRKIEILVGLFMALGFAALVMLAMQVSNLSSFGSGSGGIRSRRILKISVG